MRHDVAGRDGEIKPSIFLLGPGAIEIGGTRVPPRSTKTLGLLAYLAVESDRPHARQKLAMLLWPNAAPEAGRQSLRQALHHLRTMANGAFAHVLEIVDDAVRFNPCDHVYVDVQDMTARLATNNAADRQTAAALYRAPLLDGRTYADCDAFEDWLEATRARLHRLALNTVEEIARTPGFAPESSVSALYRADPERVNALVRAARAAEQVHAFGNALVLYQQAAGALGSGENSVEERLDLLLRQEAVLDRLGRRRDQVVLIDQAITDAETLGDAVQIALVMLRRANVSAYLGDFVSAREAASRALALFRGEGDRAGEAEALRELGFVAWKSGDYADALERARAALALHRGLGDAGGEASALHNLAEIYRGLGSPRRALQWYSQAMELHWVSRNHRGEVMSQFGIGHCWQQLGDETRSRQHYAAALDLCERYHEPTMKARALYALAGTARRENGLDEALSLMRRAIEVDRSLNFAHALGHDLLGLAQVHLARGERFEAQAAVREASIWFEGLQDAEGLEATRSMLATAIAGGSTSAVSELGNFDGQGIWIRGHLPLSEGKVYCEFESHQTGAARLLGEP